MNLWAAGDNVRDGVYAQDITVENSTYYQPCDDSEGRLWWEARWGEIFTGGAPGITEIFEWEPRQELELSFPWDDCELEPVFQDCHDWPEQDIGHLLTRENVNTGEEFVIDVWGACWPEEYCPETEKCGLD